MRSPSLWVAIAALALSLITPAAALAAPATFDVIDVAVHTDSAEAVLLVSGQLAEGTELPAEVQLAVPAGARLQWAGEILGGAPDQDPEVDYKVETRDGLDVYSFSMKSSRTAQLEVVPTDLVTSTPNGKRSNLTWTPVDTVRQVRLNFLLPTTASVLTPAEGAEMGAGPEGYSYYTRTFDSPKPGEPLSLTFDYSAGAAPAQGTASQPAASAGSDGLALAVVLAAAVLAFGGLGYGVVRKARAKAAAEQPAARPAKKVARVARVSAEAAAAFEDASDDAESEDGESGDEGASRPARKPALLITGVLVVVGVIAGVALGSGGKAAVVGDVATLQIASVDTCTKANIPMTTPAGGDLRRDANDVLAKLKSVTGVGNASIYLNESRIEVAYCDSNTSEELIRAALAPTGYVSAEVPATPQSTESTPAP